MPRPYVKALAAAEVARRPWTVLGTGAQGRTLSRDPELGAATELVELPARWEAGHGAFAALVEVFVLDGALEIGDHTLGRFSYGAIPPGVAAGPWHAREETSLLWMPWAEERFGSTDVDTTAARRDLWIPRIDSHAMPWQGTITPGFPSGAMRKTLRIDPDSGAATWLLGVLPGFRDWRQEIHPVSEEAFTLIGDISSGDQGVFRPGGYFWRPAFIPHGPFESREGTLILFRTDGPLRTDYVEPT